MSAIDTLRERVLETADRYSVKIDGEYRYGRDGLSQITVHHGELEEMAQLIRSGGAIVDTRATVAHNGDMILEKNEGRRPVRILTAMPADTNPDGDVFGGWLMGQMDLSASAVCKRRAQGRVVTVAVEGFKFLAPVKVGDEVVIYADIVKTGRSSMTTKVCAYTHAGCTGQETKVCEAIYVFVHIGEDGKPRGLP